MYYTNMIKKKYNEIPQNIRVTFWASMLLGLLAHVFVMINVLVNHDNITCTPTGVGRGVVLGRWFLEILGRVVATVWGDYNISFFNGMLVLFFISISSCLIISLFDIKDNVLAILWGGIFICFPSVTTAMIFMFTAPYYAIAIFLAVFSVYVFYHYKYGSVFSAILLSLSFGIYQAFFPIAITLFLLKMIYDKITKEINIVTSIKIGIKSCLTLIGGLFLYFALMKLCLFMFNESLLTYKGVDQMGKIDIKELPSQIILIYNLFFKIPFDQITVYSIALTKIIKYSLLFLGGYSIISFVNIIKRKEIKDILYIIFLSILFPCAVLAIVVMSPNGGWETLMIYPTVFIYLVPILLLYIDENSVKTRDILKKINVLAMVILCLVNINYIWQSNGNYESLFYMNTQQRSYFTTLITQVKCTEGYSAEYPWAFVGDTISDSSVYNVWTDTVFRYDGNMKSLINAYARNRFILLETGYNIVEVSEEEKEVIE